MMTLNNHSLEAYTHCDNASKAPKANGQTQDKE